MDLRNSAFEEYISSAEYYPPVMKDYHSNAEYTLNEC